MKNNLSLVNLNHVIGVFPKWSRIQWIQFSHRRYWAQVQLSFSNNFIFFCEFSENNFRKNSTKFLSLSYKPAGPLFMKWYSLFHNVRYIRMNKLKRCWKGLHTVLNMFHKHHKRDQKACETAITSHHLPETSNVNDNESFCNTLLLAH